MVICGNLFNIWELYVGQTKNNFSSRWMGHRRIWKQEHIIHIHNIHIKLAPSIFFFLSFIIRLFPCCLFFILNCCSVYFLFWKITSDFILNSKILPEWSDKNIIQSSFKGSIKAILLPTSWSRCVSKLKPPCE